MTPPTESLLSVDQRAVLLDQGLFRARHVNEAALASVAEVDRLTALADDLSAMLYDHLSEHSPLIERLVAAEREVCCKRLCSRCRSDDPVQWDGQKEMAWVHTDREACSANVLRDSRGAALPPLPPWRYKEQAERLRATVADLAERLEGASNLTGSDEQAIEAARALLAEGEATP